MHQSVPLSATKGPSAVWPTLYRIMRTWTSSIVVNPLGFHLTGTCNLVESAIICHFHRIDIKETIYILNEFEGHSVDW